MVLTRDMAATTTTHPGVAGERTVPMTSTTILTTTMADACRHVEEMYASTDGLVVGGAYMIEFTDGTVAEVELRMSGSIARPVWND
jgi:hypothetical protein